MFIVSLNTVLTHFLSFETFIEKTGQVPSNRLSRSFYSMRYQKFEKCVKRPFCLFGSDRGNVINIEPLVYRIVIKIRPLSPDEE